MTLHRSATTTLDNAIRELEKGKQVKVGWFESAKYEDGTQVAYVAQVLELGSPKQNIPPFAFLRQTIDMNEKEWQRFFKGLAKRILTGRMTMEQALEALGLLVAGDIKKTISTITSPALKKSTLDAREARGNTSTKPLVDSGLLLATVISLVE